ncbi:MAG: RagB/SusD family nutrient uptake outer membrane protein [Bacteroidetes bacterium]|nr:RagB/SusD family nutrient uptake outer membrane protein [Bacteroidota bacterium]
MKIVIPIFLIAAATLGSCKKQLEVKPQSSISDDQTIFDKTSAEEATRGAYDALADGSYYGTSFQSIGYLSGDNVQWTGSQSQVQEFINHSVLASNPTIASAWAQIFVAINRSNHVITKVPLVTDVSLSNAQKRQLTGEGYFIRALANFDLARVWGSVPLILKPTLTSSDNVGVTQSKRDDVYAQVLSDLNAADTLLSQTTDRYRATRKTVWALKARLYLYQNDWANAETYAGKLIADSPTYKLVTPYSAFFASNAKGTAESIFEIYYNGTTEVNGHGAQWLPQTLGGTRQWAPNDAVVALLTNASVGGNRSALVAKDNQGRWYATLYGSTTSSPSFVLRIAEQWLIRAEARAQLNKLTEALADLNAVRARAGLAASTASTQADILLAIENERRVEFAFEPHRWFDLVRTNRAATVLNITNSNKLVLPIPYQQTLLDKALVQNAGY